MVVLGGPAVVGMQRPPKRPRTKHVLSLLNCLASWFSFTDLILIKLMGRGIASG